MGSVHYSKYFQGIALPILGYVARKSGDNQEKIIIETHDAVIEELAYVKEMMTLIKEELEINKEELKLAKEEKAFMHTLIDELHRQNSTNTRPDNNFTEGVEYIFGNPGEENIDLMDSLTRSSIQFILTRHEQGAAFMADVYGRLTGKRGVCLATLGPCATNLITSVANAHLDRSPLVAITGQAERTRLHKESHQNVDTIQLFKGITKYDQQILSAHTIPEIIRKAFHLATTESPGAVHLQLPQDVAQDEVDGSPLLIGKQAKAYP